MRLINSFTHQTQLERGISASWVATGGGNGNPPYKQRLKVDAAAKNLTEFISTNMAHLKRRVLVTLALLKDFVGSIPGIRRAVDAMPPSPAKTFQAYTDGIVLAHDLVVRLAGSATLRKLAFTALSIVDMLELKEAMGRNRGKFSALLSKGVLELPAVMVCGHACPRRQFRAVLYPGLCLRLGLPHGKGQGRGMSEILGGRVSPPPPPPSAHGCVFVVFWGCLGWHQRRRKKSPVLPLGEWLGCLVGGWVRGSPSGFSTNLWLVAI